LYSSDRKGERKGTREYERDDASASAYIKVGICAALFVGIYSDSADLSGMSNVLADTHP